MFSIFFTWKIVALIAFLFLLFYSPRIYAWFYSFKKPKVFKADKNNRIALVIPARNEGRAILPLLDSLKNQTYKNFSIFIGVKEKDDPVISYGHDAGARVFVIPSQKSKGDCLDYCFKNIIKDYEGLFDAVMIVDADCILDSHFMEEMNAAFCTKGAKVVNGHKIVSNYVFNGGRNSNIVTSCNGLVWTFMDEMGNRFRSDHNLTTFTVTTGILFDIELVKKWGGWIYNETMTEDMELLRDCALNGYKTVYNSNARIYMQESPSLAETNKRRSRWMTGLTHADFIYASRLFKKRDFHSLVNNYFVYSKWIAYLFHALNIIVFFANIFNFILNAVFSHLFAWNMLFVSALALFSNYVSFFCLTLMALIVSRKDIKLKAWQWLAVLFYHPVFYMGYYKIVFKAIISRKESEWEEIARLAPSAEDTETLKIKD